MVKDQAGSVFDIPKLWDSPPHDLDYLVLLFDALDSSPFLLCKYPKKSINVAGSRTVWLPLFLSAAGHGGSGAR